MTLREMFRRARRALTLMAAALALAAGAAVSLWLNSGVPATEVARRAGHGVAVLLKIYTHCIDGQATVANQRIADALSTPEADQDPEKEVGDAGSEPTA